MKQRHQLVPRDRNVIITLIILCIELILVMPFLIAKMANGLEGPRAVLPSLWAIIELLLINVVWMLTWLLTYRFAGQYVINSVKVKNVKMGLLIIGTIFTLETVLLNNTAFVAVFSTIAYLTLGAWFDYVFDHPTDSNAVIDSTHRFIQDHKPVNRTDVQKMLKQSNQQIIEWMEKHDGDQPQSKPNPDSDSQQSH